MDRAQDLRRTGGGALLFAAAVAGSMLFNAPSVSGGPVIWLANGVLLTLLLRTPRQNWLALGLSCLLLGLPLPWLLSGGQATVLLSLAANVPVVMLGARLLARDREWVEGRRDTAASWGRFCFVAMVLVPTGCTLVASVLLRTVPLEEAPGWFLADAVGTALVTPTLLRVTPAYFRALSATGRLAEMLLLLAAEAVICVGVVALTGTPVWLLVTIPVLIVILFRDGFPGVCIGLAIVSLILLLAIANGHGPSNLMGQRAPHEAIAATQLFILFLVSILVTTAALQTERDALHAAASLNRDIYELIAMHTGDMLFVCDLAGRMLFVSPSMGEHFGMTTDDIVGIPARDFIHPEDRPIIRDLVTRIAAGQHAAPATVRFARRDGSYRDLEIIARLGPGRRQGEPPLIIGSMRDITERLAEERALRARGAELETLATTDPLTGMPNRRRYDAVIATEWSRAAREGQPLSLLVIDADRFKLVNDHFGHETGDRCLRHIAAVITGEIRRPGDFAARFGGEEFAVVLPATGTAGARILAERIRERLEEAALPLRPGGDARLTLSVGVATARPHPGMENHLFADADAALYAAKAGGRNRVVQAPERQGALELAAANGPGWIEAPHLDG